MSKMALSLIIGFFCLVTPQLYPATITELMEQHTQALKALEPHIADIKVDVSSDSHKTTYTYSSPSVAVKEKLDAYLASYTELRFHGSLRAFGSGALFGVLFAGGQEYFYNGRTDHRKSENTAIAIMAGLSLYKLVKHGPINRLNGHLKPTSDFYGTGQFLVDLICTGMGFACTYVASKWIIGKLKKLQPSQKHTQQTDATALTLNLIN